MNGPDTYRASGLRGIAELYQQFPLRLREEIVTAHARLWQEFCGRLTSEERQEVEEYQLTGGNDTYIDEIPIYEAKLKELRELYPARHAQRVKEALNCTPEEAVADIRKFEKVNQDLIQITQDLLTAARARFEEQDLREREAGQFSSVKR